MFMPFQILALWLRSLVSVGLIAGGITLLTLWYNYRSEVRIVSHDLDVAESGAPETRVEQPSIEEDYRDIGWNRQTAYLAGGLLLMAFSLGGGMLVSPALWRRKGNDEPRLDPAGKIQRLARPDGSELRIAAYGSAEGEPIVFIHGWGLDSNAWYYARRELAERFRLITWDLPGLGESRRPQDRDWSLEKLAQHLDAVIDTAGGKPVVLIGHSIGVMIALTYCKLFPQALGTRVSKLVLVHGTYTNPVRTTSKAWLYTPLQKPVVEPLCHLAVWLAPVVRVLNWMSYLNGSAHRSTEKDSFSGNETRGQLAFVTRYYCKAPPDVVARGMLAMLRYDATETLSRINIPTLIVAGENDKTCLPDASRYMATAIPDAELVILPATKHCGFFEAHTQFHETLVDFVAGNSGSAPGLSGTPALVRATVEG